MKRFLCLTVIFFSLCAPFAVLSEHSFSTKNKTTKNKIRNEILIWDNPDLEIKGEPELCFLSQRNSQLIRHVVTSCDDLFSKLIERLHENELHSFPKDRLSFLADGIARYLVHALHEFRLSSGNTYDDAHGILTRKILLLLWKLSKEHPEYFSPAKLEQVVHGSFDTMYPLFLGSPPSDLSREWYEELFSKSTIFNRDFRGKSLHFLLWYSLSDFDEVFRELLNSKPQLESLLLRGLRYSGGYHAGVLHEEVSVVNYEGDSANGFLHILILCGVSLLFYLVYLNYSFLREKFLSGFYSPTIDESEFLSSKERAELRTLRQFFSLRPNEGVSTLHKKYRTFVQKLHPDVVRDNGESFISLQERYNRTKVLLVRLEEEKHQRLGNDR